MRELVAVPRVNDPEKLIINLWKNPDGAIYARSVEIVDKISRVRFSFNAESLMHDIFTPSASDALVDIVERTTFQRGMLMLPDMRLDLQDLVLMGCRVMVTAAQNGIENIMIRFVKFYGRVKTLFKEGFHHKDSLSEDAVDQAVDALERVYMPLRNFSQYLTDLLANFPHLLNNDQTVFLNRINGEIKDLSYFSDLIVHYVNSNGASSFPDTVSPAVNRNGSPAGFVEDSLLNGGRPLTSTETTPIAGFAEDAPPQPLVRSDGDGGDGSKA